MADGWALFFLGLEFATLIAIYFNIYNPLKTKEGSLRGNQKLVRIKRFLVKISLKEINIFLWTTTILLLLSFLDLVISSKYSSVYYLFWLCVILYTVSAGVLFMSYTKWHRNKVSICDARSIEEILRMLNIKDRYISKIKSMIELTLHPNENPNDIAGWFLGAIDISDKRISK